MRRVRAIRVRVHHKEDRRLDGILRLIDEAARPRPLSEVLSTLCRECAAIARADVVSVYVRERDPDVEGGESLVMRANVGFPPGAVGNVRLRPGEGITGFVAECLRPVSVAIAREEAHYKHVPGLGEEHFPSFLGVPLLVEGIAAGVLVLQRREACAFQPAEVALATALAAAFAFALERARARADERQAATRLPSRSATLTGEAVVPGVALGRAEFLPALEGGELAGTRVPRAGDAVALALASLARNLDKTRRRLEPALEADAVRALRILALVLEDQRFRDLAITEAARSGVTAGLRRVAREYARAPYRVGASGGDAGPWLADRAVEIEDLCALVAARALDVRVPSAGGVLVGERLGAFTALAAVARRATAVVLGGRADAASLGTQVARAAGLPVLAEVAGLFVWAHPGDRMLVDAAAGVLRLNPPPTVIAHYRRTSPRAASWQP